MSGFIDIRIHPGGYTELREQDGAYRPANHQDIILALNSVVKSAKVDGGFLMPSGLFLGDLRLLQYRAEPLFIDVIRKAHRGFISIRGITKEKVPFYWPAMRYTIASNGVYVQAFYKKKLYRSFFMNDTDGGAVCMPRPDIKRFDTAAMFVHAVIQNYEDSMFTEERGKTYGGLTSKEFWKLCVESKKVCWEYLASYKLTESIRI